MLNEDEHVRHFLVARRELSISAIKIKNGNIEFLIVLDVNGEIHKLGQIIRFQDLAAFVEKFA